MEVISSPETPIWRIAHIPDPLSLHKSDPNLEHGSRYNSPASGQYSVLYFGSTVEVCYGELLADINPIEPDDQGAQQLDGWENYWMNLGSVAADWRESRSVVSVELLDDLIFVDMSIPETWQVIFQNLSSKIPELEYDRLEEQLILGHFRRITRLISGWIYGQKNEKGERLYAGIYYPSRLNSKYNVDWNCWAVFADDKPWQNLSQCPVSKTDPSLNKVARLYDLKIH